MSELTPLKQVNDMFYDARVERCGVITKSGRIIELQNTSLTPELTFGISDTDIETYLPSTLAFWHSHPESTGNSPNLSVDDYLTFLNYPQQLHIIFCYDKYIIYAVKNNLVIRIDYANNTEFPSRFEKLISR